MQKISFFGAILDSQTGRVFFPEESHSAVTELQKNLNQTVMFFLRLGLMASVTPDVCLRMRILQLARNYQASLDSMHLKLSLPPKVLFSLTHWMQSNIVLRGISFSTSSPSAITSSGAPSLGCGVHCSELTTYGNWKHFEKKLHINLLEFRAIRLALKSFLPHLQGRVVQVVMITWQLHSVWTNKEALVLTALQGSYNVMGLMHPKHLPFNS